MFIIFGLILLTLCGSTGYVTCRIRGYLLGNSDTHSLPPPSPPLPPQPRPEQGENIPLLEMSALSLNQSRNSPAPNGNQQLGYLSKDTMWHI